MVFIKLKYNFLSDCNIKKSIIPSFKSKNPISNLDVNLKLLSPGIAELIYFIKINYLIGVMRNIIIFIKMKI